MIIKTDHYETLNSETKKKEKNNDLLNTTQGYQKNMNYQPDIPLYHK